jgi:hypothetical protein
MAGSRSTCEQENSHHQIGCHRALNRLILTKVRSPTRVTLVQPKGSSHKELRALHWALPIKNPITTMVIKCPTHERKAANHAQTIARSEEEIHSRELFQKTSILSA